MKKVTIKGLPKNQSGGKVPGSQYFKNSFGANSRQFPYFHPSSEWTQPDLEERTSLSPVRDGSQNLEAEGGESAYIPDLGGLPAHFDINGPRHSEGGVPLNLPEDSFIFSDTRSMKIPSELNKFFGKGGDKKYTPADLAKQYDINKFRKQLQDPDSDPIQVKTAELMIANYNKKLGMLGLASEALKGFPDGIPVVALPYLASAAVDPDQVLPLKGSPSNTQDLEQNPNTGAYGGQWLEGGSNSWQNGPTGFGYQTGGGTGYDIPDTGVNSPAAIAKEKFWDPSSAHIGVGEWLGNAFDYIPKRFNQELTGYYEDPSTTMQRGHAPNTVRDLAGDFALNPTNWALTKDVATLGAKGAVWAGKNLAKLPGLSQAIQYLGSRPWEFYGDLAKAYGHDAAMATIDLAQKKGAGYIPALTSAAIRKGPQMVAPVMAQDNTAVPIPQFRMNQDIPKEVPAVPTTRPDTIYHYQAGGQTGWYKEGNKYTLYNNGTLIKQQDTDPKLSSTTQPQKSSKTGSSKATGVSEKTKYGITMWPGDSTSTIDPKTGQKSNTWNKANVTVNGKQVALTNKMLNDMAEKLGFDPSKEEGKDINEKFQHFIYKDSTFKDLVDKAHSTDEYGNPAAGTKFDGKLGVRWLGALFADHPESPAVVTDTKPSGKAAIELNKDAKWKPQGTYAPWWLQDAIGTAGIAGDFLRLKKYLPWAPKLEPYIPEATFVDPTRELAYNAEQSAIGTQGAAAFGSPQEFSSRYSGIQGKAAENAANILAKYSNENVNISDKHNENKAAILNQTNQFNAKTAKDLYDSTTIANQQYDNSKNQARGQLRNQYIQAITNRGQTQALNEMNPYYHVDPTTGGFIGWTGQKPPGFFGTGQTQGSKDIYDKFNDFKGKGVSDEIAYKLAAQEDVEGLDRAREMYYMNRSAYRPRNSMYTPNAGMMYNQGNPGYGAMPYSPY